MNSKSETQASPSSHLVPLDADHPGFRDQDYRARRDAIAQLAVQHELGTRPPHVDYTATEEDVWRHVWHELLPLHQRYVCTDVLRLLTKARLDAGPIPQLAEMDRLLRVVSGFSMQPVAGLVEARTFLEALADRVFLSTQYMRHGSAPLYTPEPDLVHEFIGHATTLMDPRFAELHVEFGRAARAADAARLAQIERVYWFTVEYGAVSEGGDLKAVGAGFLSSPGELAQLRSGPEVLAWDLSAMAQRDYDPTQLQPCVFAAPSFDVLLADTRTWLAEAQA